MAPGLLQEGVVAAISKMVAVPLVRVKVLLQVQAASKQIWVDQQYKGMADCLAHIPRETGVFSFWRGNLASVIRYFPTQALNFAFKDTYKQIFMSKVDEEKQFWKWFLATSMCVAYPLDFTQTHSAADIGKEVDQYPTALEFFLLLKKIPLYNYKLKSIKKRKIFVEKERMKGLLPNPQQTSFILSFFIAQVVTTFSGMLSYLFDAVRRHMMMQRRETECQDKGTVDCFMKIHEPEGLNAFCLGAFSNILRGTGGALVLVL